MDMNAGILQQPGTPFGPMGCQTQMPIMFFPTPESAPTDRSDCCPALMYTPLSCSGNAPTIIIALPQEPQEEPPNEGPIISFPPKVIDRKYPEKVNLPSIKLNEVLQKQTPKIQVTSPSKSICPGGGNVQAGPVSPRRVSNVQPTSPSKSLCPGGRNVQAGSVSPQKIPISPKSKSPGGGNLPVGRVSPQRAPSPAVDNDISFGVPPFCSSPIAQKSPQSSPRPSVKVGKVYRIPEVDTTLPKQQFYMSQDFNRSGLSKSQQAKAGEMKQNAYNFQRSYDRLRDLQQQLRGVEGKTIKDEEEKKKLESLLTSYYEHKGNAQRHLENVRKQRD